MFWMVVAMRSLASFLSVGYNASFAVMLPCIVLFSRDVMFCTLVLYLELRMLFHLIWPSVVP